MSGVIRWHPPGFVLSWDKVSYWPETHRVGYAGWLVSPTEPVPSCPEVGSQAVHYTQLLICMDIKLRSSDLHSKYFTNWAFSSAPASDHFL